MMLQAILRFLTGGVMNDLAEQARRAYHAKLDAQNNEQRIEADKLIAQIEAARAIARIEAHDRFSATRIGRLLIVVPYGLWWASIFTVSIINGLAGTDYTILDIPQKIHEMAAILIPAIIIGSVVERFKP